MSDKPEHQAQGDELIVAAWVAPRNVELLMRGVRLEGMQASPLRDDVYGLTSPLCIPSRRSGIVTGNRRTVRYCPECGAIGDVSASNISCCPDGNRAARVPVEIAEQAAAWYEHRMSEMKRSIVKASVLPVPEQESQQ